MIRVDKQSKRTQKKKKNLKIQNSIASTKIKGLRNTKIYQSKAQMQENKKINQKLEREREREIEK